MKTGRKAEQCAHTVSPPSGCCRCSQTLKKKLADVKRSWQQLKSQIKLDLGVKMVPVTLPSLLELSLKGIEELVCQFSMRAVSHMAQENRRWREKANEGIIGCSEEEEDEIKVQIFPSNHC